MPALRRGLADVALDARYGIRSLRRYPAIAVAAVLTLSLGIGSVTAIFTLLDKTALRPLPIAAPNRLVVVESYGFAAYLGRDTENRFLPYGSFEAFRKASGTVEGLFTTVSLPRVSVTSRGQTEIGTGELVGAEYFRTLGVRPALGRLLSPADDRPDGLVAVISDRLWRRRFGAEPGVVGAAITVNTVPVTIVGVVPSDFFGVTVGVAPDVFLPMPLHRRVSTDRDSPWVQILGRLPARVTPAQAAEDLTRIYQSHAATLPPDSSGSVDAKRVIHVRTAPHGIEGPALAFLPTLRLLFVAGLAVLVIACVNVTNLLLARAEVQRSELAVRTALGAGRGRLVRQVLTESALLASAGSLGGVAVAVAASRALSVIVSAGPAGIVVDTSLDGRVLGFALASTLATLLGSGLLPALRARAAVLSTRAVTGRLRTNTVLLGTQLALSLVLLAGAALLLQTARNHTQVDGGYDRRNLLTFTVNPTLAGYDNANARPLYTGLLDRLRAVSGVRDATASLMSSLNIETHFVGDVPAPTPGAPRIPIVANAVAPEYFSTLRIPLLRGREFLATERGDGEDPPTVTIINAALARRLFGDDDAVGRRLAWNERTTFEIVGVVGNTTYGGLAEARQAPRMIVYLPLYQFMLNGPVTMTIRHDASSAAVAAAARAAVAAIDPAVPVYQVRTFEQLVADSLVRQRLIAGVSAAFALVALLLAGVGLYGLMSFAVARTRREIGVRMALGADQRRVLRSTLRAAMTPVAIGLAGGTTAAVFLAPLARPFLFDISPADPATSAAAIAVLCGVALVAALLPARRASRVDPIVVLRAE